MKYITIMIGLLWHTMAIADTTGNRPQSVDALELDSTYIMNTYKNSNYSDKAVNCMVQNLYHEARGEGFAGMYAVAMVVMNRVQDNRYPDTICGVVHQGPLDSNGMPKRYRCQFSWWCDGKSDEMHDVEAFELSKKIAQLVLSSSETQGKAIILIDLTEGATHYHTIEVEPNWIDDRGMKKVGRLGQHIFYRWG